MMMKIKERINKINNKVDKIFIILSLPLGILVIQKLLFKIMTNKDFVNYLYEYNINDLTKFNIYLYGISLILIISAVTPFAVFKTMFYIRNRNNKNRSLAK